MRKAYWPGGAGPVGSAGGGPARFSGRSRDSMLKEWQPSARHRAAAANQARPAARAARARPGAAPRRRPRGGLGVLLIRPRLAWGEGPSLRRPEGGGIVRHRAVPGKASRAAAAPPAGLFLDWSWRVLLDGVRVPGRN